MPAIGIVGGMGPQASAKLLELLIKETSKFTSTTTDEDYPEIVLLNVKVPNFISNRSNLPSAKEILIEKTKLLEKADCSVIGIACNTAHLLLSDMQGATSVPFVSLPQLVATRVKEMGYKRVGLLATPTTLNSKLYDKAFGGDATLIKPSAELANSTERAIFHILANKLTGVMQSNFREEVERFKQENRLDVVILGCTELPLLYGDKRPQFVISTLDVLADGLLAYYFKPTTRGSRLRSKPRQMI